MEEEEDRRFITPFFFLGGVLFRIVSVRPGKREGKGQQQK